MKKGMAILAQWEKITQFIIGPITIAMMNLYIFSVFTTKARRLSFFKGIKLTNSRRTQLFYPQWRRLVNPITFHSTKSSFVRRLAFKIFVTNFTSNGFVFCKRMRNSFSSTWFPAILASLFRFSCREANSVILTTKMTRQSDSSLLIQRKTFSGAKLFLLMNKYFRTNMTITHLTPGRRYA